MIKRILIVDDDIALLNVLTIVLERADYSIEAIEHWKPLLSNLAYYPDLIILDRQLSGMDGAEICKQLKMQEYTRNIPVILASASSNLEWIAQNAGADAFMEKLFNIRDLLDMVRRFVPMQG